MNVKEIYALTSGNKRDLNSLNYAKSLSGQLSSSLKCLYSSVDCDQYAKFAFGTGVITSNLYKELESENEQENIKKLKSVELLYEKIRSKNTHFIHDVGNVNDIINYYGKFSDLIIAPSNIEEDNEKYSGAIHSLIFETGAPVILIPSNHEDHNINRVLICWDGSIRASRALRNSTDLLKLAEEVIIIGVNESEKDINAIEQLTQYLSSHSLKAKYIGIKRASYSIGQTILEESKKLKTDLIIMGAYSHNKIRQAILGGVTKYMLKHHNVPILMMH